MQLQALQPVLKIFYTVVCNCFLPVDLNFLGKIADIYMENLKQGSRDI